MSYQLEYFEQRTSEKFKTKFKNGRPVRYWEIHPGVRTEALHR
jgi:hypothetical protein